MKGSAISDEGTLEMRDLEEGAGIRTKQHLRKIQVDSRKSEDVTPSGTQIPGGLSMNTSMQGGRVFREHSDAKLTSDLELGRILRSGCQ